MWSHWRVTWDHTGEPHEITLASYTRSHWPVTRDHTGESHWLVTWYHTGESHEITLVSYTGESHEITLVSPMRRHWWVPWYDSGESHETTVVSPLSSGGKRDRPIANPRDTQPVRTDSKSIKPSSHEKAGLWEAKSTLSPLHMKTWDCERHNQHTKELISIKKMSINHNKDMSHLW